MSDVAFMRRAIVLAARGRGRVSPNPLVGAVIVRNGKIIGSGWHGSYGGPHAEIEAIRDAGDCRDAEIYVNLEPCAHYGKTPPCAEAIAQAGLRRVWIGMKDPNPLVSGKGADILRAAGIDVISGLLEGECRRLNMAFSHYIQSGMPWVNWKAAISLDGRVASGSGASKWITSERSRRYVQTMRGEHDAVMAGIGTVMADDPRLDRRASGFKPVRIVVDSRSSLSAEARIFDIPGQVIVFTSERAEEKRCRELRRRGAEVIKCGQERVDLKSMMKSLPEMGVISVLLEGGPTLAAAMMRENLIGEVSFFIAPILMGKEGLTVTGEMGVSTPEVAPRLIDVEWRRIGEDMLCRGKTGYRDGAGCSQD